MHLNVHENLVLLDVALPPLTNDIHFFDVLFHRQRSTTFHILRVTHFHFGVSRLPFDSEVSYIVADVDVLALMLELRTAAVLWLAAPVYRIWYKDKTGRA
jgi:hypothetical protein